MNYTLIKKVLINVARKTGLQFAKRLSSFWLPKSLKYPPFKGKYKYGNKQASIQLITISDSMFSWTWPPSMNIIDRNVPLGMSGNSVGALKGFSYSFTPNWRQRWLCLNEGKTFPICIIEKQHPPINCWQSGFSSLKKTRLGHKERPKLCSNHHCAWKSWGRTWSQIIQQALLLVPLTYDQAHFKSPITVKLFGPHIVPEKIVAPVKLLPASVAWSMACHVCFSLGP